MYLTGQDVYREGLYARTIEMPDILSHRFLKTSYTEELLKTFGIDEYDNDTISSAGYKILKVDKDLNSL